MEITCYQQLVAVCELIIIVILQCVNNTINTICCHTHAHSIIHIKTTSYSLFFHLHFRKLKIIAHTNGMTLANKRGMTPLFNFMVWNMRMSQNFHIVFSERNFSDTIPSGSITLQAREALVMRIADVETSTLLYLLLQCNIRIELHFVTRWTGKFMVIYIIYDECFK